MFNPLYDLSIYFVIQLTDCQLNPNAKHESELNPKDLFLICLKACQPFIYALLLFLMHYPGFRSILEQEFKDFNSLPLNMLLILMFSGS